MSQNLDCLIIKFVAVSIYFNEVPICRIKILHNAFLLNVLLQSFYYPI